MTFELQRCDETSSYQAYTFLLSWSPLLTGSQGVNTLKNMSRSVEPQLASYKIQHHRFIVIYQNVPLIKYDMSRVRHINYMCSIYLFMKPVSFSCLMIWDVILSFWLIQFPLVPYSLARIMRLYISIGCLEHIQQILGLETISRGIKKSWLSQDTAGTPWRQTEYGLMLMAVLSATPLRLSW